MKKLTGNNYHDCLSAIRNNHSNVDEIKISVVVKLGSKLIIHHRSFHFPPQENLLFDLFYIVALPPTRKMYKYEKRQSKVQGRVVGKQFNANPGLKVNWSINFSCIK